MNGFLNELKDINELFNSLLDSIVVVNNFLDIIYINPQAESMFQVDNSEISGKALNSLLLNYGNGENANSNLFIAKRNVNHHFIVELKSQLLTMENQTYEVLFVKQIEEKKDNPFEDVKIINFFNTMKNIQNGIFTMKRDEEGQFIYTMAVGKLLDEIGADFTTLKDKTPAEAFPKEIAFIKQIHYEIAFQGVRSTYEIELYGKHIYVDVTPVNKNHTVTEIVGTVIDISELKTTQKKLQMNEERLHSLFKHSQDYIMIFNTIGQIVKVNAKTLEFYGLSNDNYSEISLTNLVPAKYFNQLKKCFEQTIQGQVQHFDIEVKNEFHEQFFNLTFFPIITDAKIEGVFLVGKDITEQKRIELNNAFLAHHDELTSLSNRRWMEKKIQELLEQAKTNQTKLALLLIDLDRFKSINDTLGHLTGDRLLQQFAQRLLQCVKGNQIVGRMGGDEFMILCPDVKSDQEVIQLAESILQSLTIPFYIDDFELFTTTSIGISVYPLVGSDIVDLFKKADIALYKAKELGRNMYQLYDHSMNLKSYQTFILERDLRKAILHEEFTVYLQPRVDALTGKVTSAEALIRWNHPKAGLISPAEFIPLAEETGLIIPIGKWMKRKVCEHLVAWREAGVPLIPISVNISSQRFLQKDFAEELRDLLLEYQLDGKYLEIEITENSIMKNEETVTKTLQELKELGVKIYIDDFGTGYSSFNYLKTFQLDGVKIDRSFIQNISSESENASITTAMIKMAHHLKLEVIAEGVETETELNFLLEQNCHEMQGYYFGKPCPIKEFESKYVIHYQ